MGNVSKSQTKVQEKKGRAIASESGLTIYMQIIILFLSCKGENIVNTQMRSVA